MITRAYKIFLISLMYLITIQWGYGHETLTPQTPIISSDFGPRRFTNRIGQTLTDFHIGIDYPVPEGTSVLSKDRGTITQIVRSRTNLIFISIRNTLSHHFRYLHLFNDNNLPIDVSNGIDSFRFARAENSQQLVIIRWFPGLEGTHALYVLSEVNGLTVRGEHGDLILNEFGQPIFSRNTVATNELIGPAGGSGGFNPHLHIDIADFSGNNRIEENPLVHIIHPQTNFKIDLFDKNGNQWSPNAVNEVKGNDPVTNFTHARITSLSKNLDSVAFFVDDISSNQLYRYHYGGNLFVSFRTNIDILDSIGNFNGIYPELDQAGIDHFIFTEWESSGGKVAPSALADDQQHLFYVCATDIRHKQFCTSFPFKVTCKDAQNDRDPPTISFQTKIPACTKKDEITLSGTVSDACGDIRRFTINNQLVSVDQKGTFDHTLSLTEGDNTITFEAEDEKRNVATKTETVKRDTLRPIAQSYLPSMGSNNVDPQSSISVTFDENIKQGRLEVGGVGLSGSSSLNGRTLSYSHFGMAEDSTYLVSAINVRDECGNESQDFWSFTTGKNASGSQTGNPVPNPGGGGTLSYTLTFPNPDGPAMVHLVVCDDKGNVIYSTDFTIPQGANQKTIDIPLPKLCGTVTMKADITYLEQLFKQKDHHTFVDVDPPKISASPQNTTVTQPSVVLAATASDECELARLSLPPLRAPTIQPGQRAATISGLVTGLQLGNNTYTASAIDKEGNPSTLDIDVFYAGSAQVGLQTVDVECNGPGEWKGLVEGTPGLSYVVQYRKPKGGGTNWSGTIPGSGRDTRIFKGDEVGAYRWRFLLFQNSLTPLLDQQVVRSIGTCPRGDPTFIQDIAILEESEFETQVDVFSPSASPGVKDVYNLAYTSLYGYTDIDILVHKLDGSLVNVLVDEPKYAGFYTVNWTGHNRDGVLQPEDRYMVTIQEVNVMNPAIYKTERRFVEIDNTAPQVFLDRIEADPLSDRLLHIYGRITEPHPASYTLTRVQGEFEFNMAEMSLENRMFPMGSVVKLALVDATQWESGSYYVRLTALDRAGNIASTSETGETPASLFIRLSDNTSSGVRVSGRIGGQSLINIGGENPPPDNPSSFFDDELPEGATLIGNWEFSPISYSGDRSHKTGGQPASPHGEGN